MKLHWLFDPDYSVKDDPEGAGVHRTDELRRMAS